MIKVEIKNLRQIQDAFAKAPLEMTKNIVQAINKSGHKVLQEAKDRSVIQRTPVDTGRMIGSINVNFQKSGLEAVIAADTEYADAVHEGTRPHIIRPRNKRILAWRDKQIGDWRVAREVHHPGTKAQPFMRWALDRSQSAIDRFFAAALDNT